MVGLKDDFRSFAELDSDIQRALGLFIPGFVVFRRELQIDDSLVYYPLNQEQLGEIGRIELVKRDSAHVDISMQNTAAPSEADVLNFMAAWKLEEHAEALAILIERARARHLQREANYESIPALSALSIAELTAHFNQALQIAELAKQELMKQRQVQLWAVVSVVMNRMNRKTEWEGEEDRFTFNADIPTFWSMIEQAIRAITEQGEPLELARIETMDPKGPSVEAVLFRPEMRARGVGAMVYAQSLQDGTTLVVVRADKVTWNSLQVPWQAIRAELRRSEPVQPSSETTIQEPAEIAPPITVLTTSADSSLDEPSSHESAIMADVESAAPDHDLMAARKRRGKRSHYSQEERDQAVKDWEKTAKDSHSHTLVDFLAERFGDNEETYKLNVAPRTFYEWRTDFFKRNPKWKPVDDRPKRKRKRKSKTDS